MKKRYFWQHANSIGFRRPKGRLLLIFLLVLFLFPQLVQAEPPSPLDPGSQEALGIANLYYLVLYIALGVFIVVQGLIIYSAIRFRRRAPGGQEPAQIHGNTPLEIFWTAVPTAILVVLFVLTFQALQARQQVPPDALQVEVVGHRWWWEFRYPDEGVTTANLLVVPVGQPIYFTITSEEVIHSFWIPQLGGKVDAIPGKTNHYWFQVDNTGRYFGQCAEFCGIGHPYMAVALEALPQEEFAAWVQTQLAGPAAPTDPLLARGLEIVETGPCSKCHTISGTSAQAVVGPNLTDFGRRPLVGGVLNNTPDNLALWLADPPAVKPGTLMPNYSLSQEDIRALVAYLESLK